MFLGWKSGDDLAAAYRSGDVLVFTSLTDTFGNVMVEAMASGLSVAAHNVIGPQDIVTPDTGCLHDDLLTACTQALHGKNSARCVAHAKSFSWDDMCMRFLQVQPTKVPKRIKRITKVKNFLRRRVAAMRQVADRNSNNDLPHGDTVTHRRRTSLDVNKSLEVNGFRSSPKSSRNHRDEYLQSLDGDNMCVTQPFAFHFSVF